MRDGPAERTQQIVTVRAGSRRMALLAVDVSEVIRNPQLTRVPNAPAALRGVTSVRGQVVPVISLSVALGDDAAAPGEASRVVLLERSPSLGLQIDEVTSFGASADQWIEARKGQLVEVADGVARLLDLDGLLEAQFGRGKRGRMARRGAPPPQAITGPGDEKIALLTVDLAEQAYAIALDCIEEVTEIPAGVATAPAKKAAVLGAFDWRGRLLPAVSLGGLLGLPPSSSPLKRRLIVVRIGNARVGLMVDQVHSIIREPKSSLGSVPRLLNSGAGEGRIKAMLRRPDGRGLISVLSPEMLFREQSLAEILADGQDGRHEMALKEVTVRTEAFLIFRLGQEEYGLPIAAVEEVVILPRELTRLPRAPVFVLGVMNLRGAVLPVIDQRQRFAVEGLSKVRQQRVIVTTVAKLRAGFVVDEVREIMRVPTDQLQPTPDLAGDASRVFDRIAGFEVDGRMILLVDPQQLLERAEADLVKALTKSATAPHR